MAQTRAALAARFLSGRGIEIGALDCPLPLPACASARYVDRADATELRRLYPELAESELVNPDVIENGETLSSFAADSLDFIIANHMLEHCENPLGTLRAHLRRLRNGGRLFYAIPDKRRTFDKPRRLTDFAHLVADDADGGAASRWSHYLEWATLVNAIGDPAAAEYNAHENLRNGYSIHFHVWDARTFRRFLESAREYLGRTFSVQHLQTNGTEIIAILRRET